MTPAARVQAAIDVLDQINSGIPAEKALTSWARGARYAGSGDRAAVRDHVYQVLRCRRSYAALGGGQDGRALMIGALRAAGDDLKAIFTGARHAPDALSAAEVEAGQMPQAPAEQADLPDWLWARFEAAFGPQEARHTAEVLRQRAPITLRANTKVNTAAQAIETLREDGISCERSDIADTALIVTEGARRVAGSRAYLEGLVELQDASSQAAMAALKIEPGARVLDYCAGGGGKTLALAARVQARWFAHDADAGRMRDLPERARRAGVQVTCLETNAIADAAPFDLILCDVPCSGSGTWRRTPDAKWRLTETRLAELCALQQEILRKAAEIVAEDGQLAYATCSVLPEENDQQVADFLAKSPGWRLADQRSWSVTEQGDGFFLACLVKSQIKSVNSQP